MTLILDGKYRLLKPAGSGGTANVYLAEDTGSKVPVAIKVLKKALASDPDMVARLQREAALLKAVFHPNVVRLIELTEAPEGWVLVMDWAVGQRLDEVGPALVSGEVKQVLLLLGSALAAIHEAGIVHRDIKPENVMVQREPTLRLQLLDFGISRFERPAKGTFVTMKGHGAGTPSFLAPEQISEGHVDCRTDIYSFGVLAYWLLSGRLPFVGDDDFSVMQHHLQTPVPPLDIKFPDLAVFIPLTLQCLEKKPRLRFEDGTALLAALRHPEAAKKKWWRL